MLWSQILTLLFSLFQIFPRTLSQSFTSEESPAHIPGHIEATLPPGFLLTTLETSTITASEGASTTSSTPSSAKLFTTTKDRSFTSTQSLASTTSNPSLGRTTTINNPAVTSTGLTAFGSPSKPLTTVAILGIVLGVLLFLAFLLVGVLWLLRMRRNGMVKPEAHDLDNPPSAFTPPIKEIIPIQESQVMEQTHEPVSETAAKNDHPPPWNSRRLRSSVGGL